MWSVASVCLLLAACSPVLLYGDDAPQAQVEPERGGASPQTTAGAPTVEAPGAVAQGTVPQATISVRSVDCGRCFELTARGLEGTPPYRFEWEDGSAEPLRRVCAEAGSREVSLIVEDATAARSLAYRAQLEADADAACATDTPPDPTALLCLMNASFDGTPAVNVGVPTSMFDATPWNSCSGAAGSGSAAGNTPEVIDAIFAQVAPTDGDTLLGLLGGEQVSQTLCEAPEAGTTLYVELDLGCLDDGANGMAQGPVALEIWGGLTVDCSQRQLLWTSPALRPGLTHYCAALTPSEPIDQLTLRAPVEASTGLPAGYVLVDHLVPVDRCP
ncbi:MAG: hypothetical protein ABW321_34155 [Polyangiales bacterium]